MTDPLQTLRDALSHSPNNLPLRQHLAESLVNLGQLDQAEQEYKQAIAAAPTHTPFRVGLAEVYYRQGKNSPALVVVEDLLKKPDTPPSAYLLHAKLLFRAGDVERAVRQYKSAIDLDGGVADLEFAGRLESAPTRKKAKSWMGAFVPGWMPRQACLMSRSNGPMSASKMSAEWMRSKMKSA